MGDLLSQSSTLLPQIQASWQANNPGLQLQDGEARGCGGRGQGRCCRRRLSRRPPAPAAAAASLPRVGAERWLRPRPGGASRSRGPHAALRRGHVRGRGLRPGSPLAAACVGARRPPLPAPPPPRRCARRLRPESSRAGAGGGARGAGARRRGAGVGGERQGAGPGRRWRGEGWRPGLKDRLPLGKPRPPVPPESLPDTLGFCCCCCFF